MAPPTKKRGISHGISFSTTKITLKIPTFLRYGIVEEGILICVIVQTKGTVLLVCLWHIQTKRTVPLVCLWFAEPSSPPSFETCRRHVPTLWCNMLGHSFEFLVRLGVFIDL